MSLSALPTTVLPSIVTLLSNLAAPVTSNVPAKSALASVKVTAVVVLLLSIRFPELFVKVVNVTPASLSATLPPSASKLMLPATSISKLPADTV